MIIVVEDPDEFHNANFSMNKKHYSGLARRLPITMTCGMQAYGGIYFHPLVTVEGGQRIKYGVVSKKLGIEALTEWTNFALPGRTHKTIKTIREDVEVAAAIEKNRQMALSLAILLNYN